MPAELDNLLLFATGLVVLVGCTFIMLTTRRAVALPAFLGVLLGATMVLAAVSA